MSERRSRRKQRATPAPRHDAARAARPAEAPPTPRPREETEAATQPQGNQQLTKATTSRGAAAAGPDRKSDATGAARTSTNRTKPEPLRRPPAAAESSHAAAAESPGADASVAHGRTHGHGRHASIERVVVADDARDIAPGQMRKTDFLATLEIEVTDAAERELAPAGRSVGDCPWIPYWFAYYQRRDVGQIARALVTFAPEAGGAASVGAAIDAVRNRVVRSVRQSLALGRPVDTPDGMPARAFDPDAPAPPPAGVPTTDPFLKESPNDAGGAARSSLGLGAGQPLDAATRGRMESAFGADLSHVRVHSDARGQTAAGRAGARAFAHGGDVAFAPGQHRPGTPVGDALLAHELAHTLQQRTSTGPAAPLNAASALEADADRSAFGAVGRLWTGTAIGMGTLHTARPTLTSGLHIARCGEAPVIQADSSLQPKKTVDVQPHVIEGTERSFDEDIAYANTRVFPQANMELNQLTAQSYSEQAARKLVGEDLELAEGSTRSKEERDLVNKFKSTTQVNVVYVHSFEGCTELMGRSYSGTDMHGAREGMVVVTDQGSMTTLPHEIGHLMSLPHRNGGDALMTGSGTTDRTVGLNQSEIRKLRASNYAK